MNNSASSGSSLFLFKNNEVLMNTTNFSINNLIINEDHADSGVVRYMGE